MHHQSMQEAISCEECMTLAAKRSNEDQRRTVAKAKILDEFDELAHTVHAPNFKDEGEAGCLSVAVVRSFLRNKLKEL